MCDQTDGPAMGHAALLLTQLRQLYERHLLTDLVLHTDDGRQFRTHKSVLVSFSAYLMSLLDSGHLNSGTLLLNDMCGSSLEKLLSFMYSGSLQLDDTNVWLVLGAATRMEIPAAVVLCQEFLRSNTPQLSQQTCERENYLPRKRSSPKRKGKKKKEELYHEPALETVIKPDSNDVDDDDEDDDNALNLETTLFQDNCPKDDLDAPRTRKSKRKGRPRKADSAAIKPPIRKGKCSQGKRAANHKGLQETRSTYRKRCSAKKSPSLKSAVVASPKRKKNKKGSKIVNLKQEPQTFVSKYTCQKCNKTFRYTSLCKLHQRSHLSNLTSWTITPKVSVGKYCHRLKYASRLGIGNVTCVQCDKRFKYFSMFCRHYQEMHAKHKWLKCRRCERTFKSRTLLQKHQWTKHGLHPQLRNVQQVVCAECGRTYKHAKLLSEHLGIIHPGLPKTRCRPKYQCTKCEKTFAGKRNYMQHLLTHVAPPSKNTGSKEHPWSKKRNWSCEECSESFPVYMKLRTHVEQVHPGIIFSCQLCRYYSPVHAMLEVHMLRKHHNKTDKICEFCGKTFSKRYYLKFHRYSKHNVQDPSIKVFKCEEVNCAYVAFTKNCIRQHKLSHQSDKPFDCEHCGRKLKTAVNLQKHVNKVHLNIRPYVCDQCGMSYGEECELKAHIARHDREKKFKCQLCPFASHDKGNLENHRYSVHKVQLPSHRKLYNCEICGLTTRAKTFFTEHMNVHNNVKPFTCPHCSRTFSGKSSMKRHCLWVHTKKSVKCDHCSYVTSTNSHLREHVRIMHTHRDVKPYKCAYCDFCTALSGNCRKHIKNKHKGCEIKWVKVCDKYSQNVEALKGVTESEAVVTTWEETAQTDAACFPLPGVEVTTEHDKREVQMEEPSVPITFDQQVVTTFYNSSTIGMFVEELKQ